MHEGKPSAGDLIPPDCRPIEVHVAELKQLFNAIDPSPFRERDLDPNAEEFIVEWGREVPRDVPLALVVHLDRPAGLPEEPSILRDAVREFFAVTVAAGNLIAKALQGQHLGEIIKESLLIGGWVAMWRPLEVFLYDWWPIRQEAQLYDRLSAMPVRIVYKDDTKPDAWRSDWPAVSPALRTGAP